MVIDKDKDEVKKEETIGMLLDVEHIYGGFESRMGPIIAVICIACAPILLYIYFTMWLFMPIWVLLIIEIVVTVTAILIIPGKQKERKEKFKRQLYSEYSEPAQLLNIKTIHPDGCIEFINGTIYYIVCCFNGTTDNEVQRSVQLKKFLANLVGDFEYDTYMFNIDEAPALRAYYDKISTFDKSAAAVNFVKIIDHSLKLVEDGSNVICTCYVIRGSRSDWKTLALQIDTAINSKLARCYKEVHRVKNPDEINDIINRDADTVINISELLRRKYANQQYGTSKVLAYDLPDDREIIQGGSNTNRIIPTQTNHSFHKVYKEGQQ